MKYKIKCWIPIEEDDGIIYESLESAELDKKECEFLQPENKYIIEEVENGM